MGQVVQDQGVLLALAREWNESATPGPGDARQRIADGLQSVIPADASLVSFVEDGRLGTISTEPSIAAWRDARLGEWARTRHPVVEHWQRTGDDRAIRLSDVVGTAALHRLEVYQTFWRPFAVERTLGVRVRVLPGGAVADLACYRTGRDFDEREVEALDRLSVVAARLLSRAALQPLVAALAAAYPLSWREAEVLTRATLGESTTRVATQLVISEATVRKHLERAYRRIEVHSRASAAALVRATWSGRSVTTPVPARPDALGALTPRQREVVLAAAAGRSRVAIADELGIAPGTVKRHLEDAYDRLGVTRRAEAAALIEGCADRQ